MESHKNHVPNHQPVIGFDPSPFGIWDGYCGVRAILRQSSLLPRKNARAPAESAGNGSERLHLLSRLDSTVPSGNLMVVLMVV